MRIIKVGATNSTNSFAKDLYKNNLINEATCIVAHSQTEGRGQRGSQWQSNEGENLTFSVVFPNLNINAGKQFLITASVAMALVEGLKSLKINRLKIKWPNDIMASGKKIAGILIENFVSNGRTTTSIIGIGLNVNQTHFFNLPNAASLKMLTETSYNLDQVLQICLQNLQNVLLDLKERLSSDIIDQYHQHLFKYQQPSTFQLPNQKYFVGVIEGVSSTGKLMVQTEDKVQEYDIKEIKLCF
ncbi:MAG TPA: biotin--[acetyl-CoA-carboxylase] ligase [Salinimicrobium sp.]|nr:biotin--[acetyl-CoA-carboxylase] ligase [Salinimicrobium sp.]